MAAPKNNTFWEARSTHGRKPIFKTPNQLWKACTEYFKWVEANPLKESKAAQFQGVFVYGEVKKMRPMTLNSLCIFLNVARKTWDNYHKRKGFLPVTTQVEVIIYEQKFAGAAADLLNPNIIARELGLADKQELSGPGGAPIETVNTNFTKGDAAKKYMELIKKP